MSRLPNVNRDDLPPEGQAVWDRIASVRTGVRGPYQVLVRVPGLADRFVATEDYFRFEAALPAADRELVILATGRELGAEFAWAVHIPQAQRAGTRPEAVEIVRAHGALDGLTDRERLLVEVARTLLRTRTLPDALFNQALAELGRQQLVELVILIGQYNTVGCLLNGFGIPPPDDGPRI